MLSIVVLMLLCDDEKKIIPFNIFLFIFLNMIMILLMNSSYCNRMKMEEGTPPTANAVDTTRPQGNTQRSNR